MPFIFFTKRFQNFSIPESSAQMHSLPFLMRGWSCHCWVLCTGGQIKSFRFIGCSPSGTDSASSGDSKLLTGSSNWINFASVERSSMFSMFRSNGTNTSYWKDRLWQRKCYVFTKCTFFPKHSWHILLVRQGYYDCTLTKGYE